MKRDLCYFYNNINIEAVYNAYLDALGKDFGRSCREEPYHTLTFGLNFSARYNMNGGSCTLRFMPHNGGVAVNFRYSVAQLAGARYGAHSQTINGGVAKRLGFGAIPYKLHIDEFVRYSTTAAQQPKYEQPKYEPIKEQPHYQQPKYEPVNEQPHYQQPKYKPVNEQPKYEPIKEQPHYQQPKYEPVNEQPKYEPVNEQPHYQQPKYEPVDEQPKYEPIKEQPKYEHQAFTVSEDTCPNCGKALMQGARFCTGCGKPIEKKLNCTACGAALRPDDNFCPLCGKRI